MDRRNFVKATGIAALSAGASPAAGTSETDAETPAAGERGERNEAPSGGARQHSYYANVTRW